jgi:fermentation-respiration switch protein FrsA (DUF1100 family)
VIFHFTDDKVVPLKSGENIYNTAKEPKEMYILNGTIHGYNPELGPYIEKELRDMFK